MTRMTADTFWTPESFRGLTGGRWLARRIDDTKPTQITGISIDSRTLRPGEAFVAIEGEHTDGHRFLQDALDRGAPLIIVQRPEAPTFINQEQIGRTYILFVDDTVRALAKLATAYRRVLANTSVIAITGSSGKTSTKAIIDTVLSTRLRGTASPKSFNNNIGVPLTILSARSTDQYLVAEVGTNAPGEIRELAAIVQPEIAVITNIGRAHLEGLGSIEGVVREKASLLTALPADEGWAILPTDGPDLSEYVRPDINVVRFGESENADLRITRCDCSPHRTVFQVNGHTEWTIPLTGRHQAHNALAAIAVARRMGMTDAHIAEGLSKVRLPGMRFEEHSIHGIRVINDAYNANPDSTAASIDSFLAGNHHVSGRVVLALGEMLELGEHTAECHEEIGALLLQARTRYRIDRVLLVGDAYTPVASRLRESIPDCTIDHAKAADDDILRGIIADLRPGDAVLLKASRRVGLERFVELLRDAGNQTAAEDPQIETTASTRTIRSRT